MDCVFCKIVSGKIPSEILYKTDNLIVIKDINPSADTHLLIIPKKHIKNAEEITRKDDKLLGLMFDAAKKMIKKAGVKDKYRLSINGGSLLEVNHLHMHLMGGNFKHKL